MFTLYRAQLRHCSRQESGWVSVVLQVYLNAQHFVHADTTGCATCCCRQGRDTLLAASNTIYVVMADDRQQVPIQLSLAMA
jgi:hypothetical protein